MVRRRAALFKLSDLLGRNSVDEGLRDDIRKTLEMCDFVRFSSDGSGYEMRKKLLYDTREILNKLKEKL